MTDETKKLLESGGCFSTKKQVLYYKLLKGSNWYKPILMYLNNRKSYNVLKKTERPKHKAVQQMCQNGKLINTLSGAYTQCMRRIKYQPKQMLTHASHVKCGPNVPFELKEISPNMAEDTPFGYHISKNFPFMLSHLHFN